MKKRIGLFGALAMMAIAPLAHADYQIAYQIGGGAITSCLDNADNQNLSSMACGTTASGITLTGLTGGSNSPGVPSLADEFSSSGRLVNNNTTGTVTIHIWYSAAGFTMPVTGGSVTAINYASNSSGTSVQVVGGASTLGLESCADETAAGGVGSNFCSAPAATLTNPVLNYPNGLGGSVNNSIMEVFSPLTATYSLEQEVTVVLNNGDTVNFSDSQGLTPVPEPMSIALLGGVLLVTVRTIQRRRKQQNSISV